MEISDELQRHLKDRGIYLTEAGDSCRRILGSVRFVDATHSGVWCSRQCRDGSHAHSPGTCRACGARLPEGKRSGAKYCDDACKQAAHRSKREARPSETAKLSVTKTPFCAAFSSVECAVRATGHPGVDRALETLPLRFAGGNERPEAQGRLSRDRVSPKAC